MRLLLDANILLDCLVSEKDGSPRQGKLASEMLLDQCDQGVHAGLVAWHTLPIVAYYYEHQRSEAKTGEMIDGLLAVLEVPTVGHREATAWRSSGITDFEDALQIMSAQVGHADVIITRNVMDYNGCPMTVMRQRNFWLRIHYLELFSSRG